MKNVIDLNNLFFSICSEQGGSLVFATIASHFVTVGGY